MKSASSQQQLGLSDLPIGALSHVSSYLPSSLPRALFAVALNYYHDIDSSSAIVGEQRDDVLDFGDIEKELAVKLTDDDIKNILLSIDAINNLKTMRLTNLLNISGIGLEPLRGSTMIEKIDLSLVGKHKSPDLSPAPPIACIDVLPILDKIIDMGEDCSLKLLIFPKKWREQRKSEFHSFLVRYNALLRSREVTCLKCHHNLSEGNLMLIMEADELYGSQKFTCFDCLKHYCHGCYEEDDGEEIDYMSALCRTCNRRYCLNCSRERLCNSCNEWFCVECIKIEECARCAKIICLNCASERECRNNCCEGKIWCDYCVRHSDALVSCENCGGDYCMDCYDNPNNVYSIDYCDECGKNLCGKCRVIKCKERMGDGCTGCYRFAFPALLEDKERQRQQMQTEIDTLLKDKERQRQEMQAEIDEQKKEISELKEENGELKRKLKDLNGEVGEE